MRINCFVEERGLYVRRIFSFQQKHPMQTNKWKN